MLGREVRVAWGTIILVERLLGVGGEVRIVASVSWQLEVSRRDGMAMAGLASWQTF